MLARQLPTMAARAYYHDTYAAKLSTRVLHCCKDEGGRYMLFQSTIFHPQGGGQPSDVGHVTLHDVPGAAAAALQLPVLRLAIDESTWVKHYVQNEMLPDEVWDKVVGSPATMEIDLAKRLEFAPLHTAGHLLAHVVQQLYPDVEAVKGNHFPGESFVAFKGDGVTALLANRDDVTIAVNSALRRVVDDAVPIMMDTSETSRFVTITGFPATMCGGTHVRSTAELGCVTVRNLRKDKQLVRVGYQCTSP